MEGTLLASSPRPPRDLSDPGRLRGRWKRCTRLHLILSSPRGGSNRPARAGRPLRPAPAAPDGPLLAGFHHPDADPVHYGEHTLRSLDKAERMRVLTVPTGTRRRAAICS